MDKSGTAVPKRGGGPRDDFVGLSTVEELEPLAVGARVEVVALRDLIERKPDRARGGRWALGYLEHGATAHRA